MFNEKSNRLVRDLFADIPLHLFLSDRLFLPFFFFFRAKMNGEQSGETKFHEFLLHLVPYDFFSILQI